MAQSRNRSVEDVGASLQEEQAEDIVLVRGGVETLLAEAIGGTIEMAFELGKRESGHPSDRRLLYPDWKTSVLTARDPAGHSSVFRNAAISPT